MSSEARVDSVQESNGASNIESEAGGNTQIDSISESEIELEDELV